MLAFLLWCLLCLYNNNSVLTQQTWDLISIILCFATKQVQLLFISISWVNVRPCNYPMEFSNLCNYNFNRTTFQIVFHKLTSQTLCQNVMGFQIKKWLSVTEQGIDFIHVHCRGHQDLNHVYQAFWETQQVNMEINYTSIFLWNIRYYY